MAADTAPGWATLFDQVPRAPFIPDTIWEENPNGAGFSAVSRQAEPERWAAAVAANAPVITQLDLSDANIGSGREFPTSSSSQPSLMADMLDALAPRPGDAVLEIGTGTGWNAALLQHRVGPHGRVVTVEVDRVVADQARCALAVTGFDPEVVTGDGEAGWPAAAPYDRIISTASVRELIPKAWLEQLRSGGRLVAPWGTDYGNGALLTLELDEDGVATGRFAGDLAFMRLRGHRRGLFGWEPNDVTIAAADVTTTDVRGADLDRMFDPAKGRFAIGARMSTAAIIVEWNKHGTRRHVIDLDDHTTRSFARVEADLTNLEPFTVRQLGPRRLWDEAIDAYDWWHEHDEPGPDRLGVTITPTRQTVWLDTPGTTVRTWDLSHWRTSPHAAAATGNPSAPSLGQELRGNPRDDG